MKDRLRALLSTFIALSIIGLVIMLYMHYSRREGEKIAFTVEKGSGVEVKTVHFVASRDGRALWEMYADSVTRPKNDSEATFTNVRALLRTADSPGYTLTADKAVLNEPLGIVDAIGNVRMTSTDGDRLRTDSPVRYTMKLGRAESRQGVEIASKGVKITGTGLLIDAAKNKLYIQSNVKAIITNDVI